MERMKKVMESVSCLPVYVRHDNKDYPVAAVRMNASASSAGMLVFETESSVEDESRILTTGRLQEVLQYCPNECEVSAVVNGDKVFIECYGNNRMRFLLAEKKAFEKLPPDTIVIPASDEEMNDYWRNITRKMDEESEAHKEYTRLRAPAYIPLSSSCEGSD